jgi:hypothetical protein
MPMRKTLLTLSIAVVMAVAGCDRNGSGQTGDDGVPPPMRPPALESETPHGSSRVDFKPPIAPATPANPVTPVVPARSPSFLTIDNKQVLFPPSKMAILNQKPGDFRVRLCTDDPPTAIEPGYAGNSFLFDMKLGIDSPAGLRTARWIGTSADFDPDAGIFLGGYKNPYRPEDVQMTFSGSPDDLSIYVEGTFSHADPKDPFGPPETVKVHGTVNVAQPTPAK